MDDPPALLAGDGDVLHCFRPGRPARTDFDAYARYVTTDVFLVSHLGASVFGAGLAILGAIALTAHLVPGRAARTAIAGLALTAVTNVFMAAAFGGAAFVQPGIGRPHLAGVAGMPDLNADTAYGTARFAAALGASVFLIAAAVVVGVAIARTDRRLRWYGSSYAALLTAFTLSGFALPPAQAWLGFAFAAAAAALAVRLPRITASPGPAPGSARPTSGQASATMHSRGWAGRSTSSSTATA